MMAATSGNIIDLSIYHATLNQRRQRLRMEMGF